MEQDPTKVYPRLRSDLRISRQSVGGEVHFVVKDPVKNTFFRFSNAEWQIISLFDGESTLAEICEAYNESHRDTEMDLATLTGYRDNLESNSLLLKSSKDMNFMLVEKMKESRQSRLLAVKGSIFYKRFPLVDPDRFFHRLAPKIAFFWTWKFVFFSLLVMLAGSAIILLHWAEFKDGVFALTSFQHASLVQMLSLWVTIYAVIAIHEMGHGLTCRHFGGEVHEIGFLLLFFQPCLYCNVNDAWLLDKKWKQVAVTVAGGYIEYFLASVAAIGWVLTAPGSAINTICFQVMSVGALSTILFNLNPLIKLDGYYLLADFLGTPNLRERAFAWVKYLASRYIFRVAGEEPQATRREQKIFLLYGLLAGIWTTSTMLGLLYMIRNVALNFFPQVATLVTVLGVWKFFGAQIKKAGGFLFTWYAQKRTVLRDPRWRRRFALGVAVGLLLLLVPVPFTIGGGCSLEPSFVRVIRAQSHGMVRQFLKSDGEMVQAGDPIIQLENKIVENNLKMVTLEVERLEYNARDALVRESPLLSGIRRELASKRQDQEEVSKVVDSLELRYEYPESGVLSCKDEVVRTHAFIKKGEEVCQVVGTSTLTLSIQARENMVRFIAPGQPVSFKLLSNPLPTYQGKVRRIRAVPQPDPYNPKARIYTVDMVLENAKGELQPGLSGLAKIQTGWVPIGTYLYRSVSNIFNLDLLL